MKKIILILCLSFAFTYTPTEKIYITPTNNGKIASTSMVISVNTAQGLTYKVGNGGFNISGNQNTGYIVLNVKGTPITLKNGTDQWRMTVSGTELQFTYSNDNFVTSKTGRIIGIE